MHAYLTQYFTHPHVCPTSIRLAAPIDTCGGTRGFWDQNAGLGAGWLVATGGSKKKKDFINFLPDEAFLSTNDNYISSIYYIKLESTEICKQMVKIACIFNACC
jgi:hypothetical protein